VQQPRYAHGWTLRQIGAELGIPWSTVSDQLQRVGIIIVVALLRFITLPHDRSWSSLTKA
jgi:hypothetical protein